MDTMTWGYLDLEEIDWNLDDLTEISPKMSKISQNEEYQNWDDLTEISLKITS